MMVQTMPDSEIILPETAEHPEARPENGSIATLTDDQHPHRMPLPLQS